MAKVTDLNINDDASLIDSFVKATAAKKLAEDLYEAHKAELATRGLLVDGGTVYGNKYLLNTTGYFSSSFDQKKLTEDMGEQFVAKYKKTSEKVSWRITAKEITVVTTEIADKVAAL